MKKVPSSILLLQAICLVGCTQAYYEKTSEDRAFEELSVPEENEKYKHGALSAGLAMLTLGMVGDGEYDEIQKEKARLKEEERVQKILEEEEALKKRELQKYRQENKKTLVSVNNSLVVEEGDSLYDEIEEEAAMPLDSLQVGLTTYPQVVELFGMPTYLIERLGRPKQARFKVKDFEYKYIPFLREEPEFAIMEFDKNDILRFVKVE